MIYFLSDTHFCHSKPFLYEPRGFETVDEMNAEIVARWNRVVTDEDEVYLLGDVMLNDNEKGIELLQSLNGKIHIICGNHDTEARRALYQGCRNVVEVCDGKFFRYKKYHFFLSHYPCLTSNFDDNKPLCARCINLCGHSHTTDRFADMSKGIIYHVDCDAHNCTPVAIDEIITDIKWYLALDK